VTDALRLRLGAASTEALGNTANVLAHASFLRGEALFGRRELTTNEQAVADLEAAVSIDPLFARA
jgi:hypothetical protein